MRSTPYSSKQSQESTFHLQASSILSSRRVDEGAQRHIPPAFPPGATCLGKEDSNFAREQLHHRQGEGRIQDEEVITSKQQQFILEGKQLEDERTLSDFEVRRAVANRGESMLWLASLNMGTRPQSKKV